MKRVIVAILTLGLMISILGCSEDIDTKPLSLSYDGKTIETVLIQYKNAEGKSLLVENGKNDDEVVFATGDTFDINEEFEVIYLIINNLDSDDAVEEVIVRDNPVKIDVEPGNYTYSFIVDWGDETGRYVKKVTVN